MSTLADGFVFTEGPRWRDGSLWCSDMHDHRVVAVSPDGEVRTVVTVDGDLPSGLGWLEDGRMLVVSMNSRRVLRLEATGELAVHADLSDVAIGVLNDMIVATDGTAYVGDMGLGLGIFTTEMAHLGQVFVVRPDGTFDVAAADLRVPNGMILTPDEGTLLVAETGGGCITQFDRLTDGRISGARQFAALTSADPQVPVAAPDGICLDEEGAVWLADTAGKRVVRVRAGGVVTDAVDFAPEIPIACVLGGPERTQLYVCTAVTWRTDELEGTRDSRIAVLDVTVPGSGRP